MTKEFNPDRLDAKAFVQAGARLAGHDSLLKYERLAQEAKGLHPDLRVDWEAQGEWRAEAGTDGGPMWMPPPGAGDLSPVCQACPGAGGPRHDECPTQVPMASSDEDFEAAEAERPNPFAALASLRVGKSDK